MTNDFEELRRQYRNRNLLEELSYESIHIRRGYLSQQDADFLRWLCDAAYREIRPRLLMLDEIRNSLKPGEVVWLEDFDKCDVIPGIRFRLVNEGGDEAIEFHVMDGFIAPKLDEYGVRWRCWNKKPTNAQRLTTAWKKQLLQYGDNDVLQGGLAPAT